MSARMVGPLLQRDVRPGILRPAVPAGVSVPERRRLPQRERRMQLRSRLHESRLFCHLPRGKTRGQLLFQLQVQERSPVFTGGRLVLLYSRLARTGLLHQLSQWNLGPGLQPHLHVWQRRSVQRAGRPLHVHSRLERGEVRTPLPGRHLRLRMQRAL